MQSLKALDMSLIKVFLKLIIFSSRLSPSNNLQNLSSVPYSYSCRPLYPLFPTRLRNLLCRSFSHVHLTERSKHFLCYILHNTYSRPVTKPSLWVNTKWRYVYRLPLEETEINDRGTIENKWCGFHLLKQIQCFVLAYYGDFRLKITLFLFGIFRVRFWTKTQAIHRRWCFSWLYLLTNYLSN